MNRHEDEKSRLLQELQVAEAPVPVGVHEWYPLVLKSSIQVGNTWDDIE